MQDAFSFIWEFRQASKKITTDLNDEGGVGPSQVKTIVRGISGPWERYEAC